MTEHTAWSAVAVELRGLTRRVFGLPGDDMTALAPLADAGIEVVITRSQRAAVFMALGYAMATGELATVLVGRGPGLAGALPGLLEAAAQPVGLLVLAGGSPIGHAVPHTFQFAPQVEMVKPLVRMAHRAETIEDAGAAVRRAVLMAGRPGGYCAYVEIPDPPETAIALEQGMRGESTQIRPWIDERGPVNCPWVVQEAIRPVVLIGGGARHVSQQRMTRWAGNMGSAILSTASGRGIIVESHPLYIGVAGFYLPPAAQKLVAEADLLIALGSRLEETATAGLPAQLPIVQVNTRFEDFSARHPGELVLADVSAVVDSWERRQAAEDVWVTRVRALRAELDTWARARSAREPLLRLLRDAVGALPPGSVWCQENGLLDIWGYLFPMTTVPPGVTVVAPSEQTTLGFGVAAAFGAACSEGEGVVLAVTGDGAFGTMLDELSWVSRSGRSLIVLVLDNHGFGWLEEQNSLVNGKRGVFTAPQEGCCDGHCRESHPSPDAAHEIVLDALSHAVPGSREVIRVCCAEVKPPPVLRGDW